MNTTATVRVFIDHMQSAHVGRTRFRAEMVEVDDEEIEDPEQTALGETPGEATAKLLDGFYDP